MIYYSYTPRLSLPYSPGHILLFVSVTYTRRRFNFRSRRLGIQEILLSLFSLYQLKSISIPSALHEKSITIVTGVSLFPDLHHNLGEVHVSENRGRTSNLSPTLIPSNILSAQS